MTESKEHIPEVFYGVKLSNITDEMLEGIVGIYSDIAKVSTSRWRIPTLEQVNSQLRYSNAAEFRIGSSYSMNSKLWVRTEKYLRDESRTVVDTVVVFKFDPNMDFRNEKEKQEIMAKSEQFRKAASDYLLQTGLAVALEPK